MQDPHHAEITDSVWFEKVAVITLIAGIVYIGSLPLGLSDMLHDSLGGVMAQLGR